MNFVSTKERSWSSIGLWVAIGSTILAALLAIADGIFKGPLNIRYAADIHDTAIVAMFATWAYDLRQTMDGVAYIGAIVFIGGKFFEARTTFTIGFDQMNAAAVSMEGPDQDNTVWLGQRYATHLEAQAVAEAIESRLKSSHPN